MKMINHIYNLKKHLERAFALPFNSLQPEAIACGSSSSQHGSSSARVLSGQILSSRNSFPTPGIQTNDDIILPSESLIQGPKSTIVNVRGLKPLVRHNTKELSFIENTIGMHQQEWLSLIHIRLNYFLAGGTIQHTQRDIKLYFEPSYFYQTK